MVLMPVYVDTAEGFRKPLVILPAAVMPFASFIIIFSQRHCPFVLADSLLSHDPLFTPLHLPITLTLLIAFVPFDLPDLGTFSLYDKNNIVKVRHGHSPT